MAKHDGSSAIYGYLTQSVIADITFAESSKKPDKDGYVIVNDLNCDYCPLFSLRISRSGEKDYVYRIREKDGKKHGNRARIGSIFDFTLEQAREIAIAYELSDVNRVAPAAVVVSTDSATNLIEPEFDPFLDTADMRSTKTATIHPRSNQTGFRGKVLKAYGSQCLITGCGLLDIVEVCHIEPWKGKKTDSLENGIPLRCDFHKLFDKHLITIVPNTPDMGIGTILISKQILRRKEDKYIWNLDGTSIHINPNNAGCLHKHHLKYIKKQNRS